MPEELNFKNVTHENLRNMLNMCMKDLKLDNEDFIGTSYTENEELWMKNFNSTINDTALYSTSMYKRTEDAKHRLMIVLGWKKAINDLYTKKLQEEGQYS